MRNRSVRSRSYTYLYPFVSGVRARAALGGDRPALRSPCSEIVTWTCDFDHASEPYTRLPPATPQRLSPIAWIVFLR
jgi:hypothetical protein